MKAALWLSLFVAATLLGIVLLCCGCETLDARCPRCGKAMANDWPFAKRCPTGLH